MSHGVKEPVPGGTATVGAVVAAHGRSGLACKPGARWPDRAVARWWWK
jgi:hypothetical protein